MLKKFCSVLLVFCMLLTTVAAKSTSEPVSSPETPATEEVEPTPELTQRERDWNADLNYLRRHYKMYHKDPFYYCSEEEFDLKIDQLAAKVGELTDSDIYFEIAKIIAGMGDIHTVVSAPEFLYDNLFPVVAGYVGDKMYLEAYKEGYEQFEPYLLREIVAINGVDVSYLTRKLESITSPLNSWYAKSLMSSFYFIPAFFDWAGCGYTDNYTFQILNENQEVESIEVPVISWDDFSAAAWVDPENWDSLHYLKGGNWADYFEEENGDYIYVSFTEMMSLTNKPYQELLEATAELIEAHPDCDKLVIDIRFHPGGLSSAVEYIREHVQILKAPSIEHTFVLTSGHTTSGAIGCMTVFKEELNAVAVGEPTGQFTSFFTQRQVYTTPLIVLPLSQLSISVADYWTEGEHPENEFYDENGRLYEWENTVLPDVFVSQDIEDIRQGKDSVIQWLLEQ